ncbi:MAG: rRNA maturation RNase YbeY [Motiliproteus sp.]|nr:rRNA maturation RNase YbeY [Motiliproteus sp.]
MSIELDLQLATASTDLPSEQQLQQWVELALIDRRTFAEITIRIVDNQESQTLNGQYRGKHKPTNVLSFPFEAPEGIELDLLGDLVICAPVVSKEATEQQKQLMDHWAHMVLHGTLHLLGYDHISEQQALEMESLETQLLARIDIADPYQSPQEAK